MLRFKDPPDTRKPVAPLDPDIGSVTVPVAASNAPPSPTNTWLFRSRTVIKSPRITRVPGSSGSSTPATVDRSTSMSALAIKKPATETPAEPPILKADAGPTSMRATPKEAPRQSNRADPTPA